MHVVYKNPDYQKPEPAKLLVKVKSEEKKRQEEIENIFRRTNEYNPQPLPGFGYAPDHPYRAPKPDTPKMPTIKLTYIYLMKNNRNGYYKIGQSLNPSFREKTLQAEDPDILLIDKWHTQARWERILHQEYKSKRLRGEWFKLTAEDVRHIKSTMKNHLT